MVSRDALVVGALLHDIGKFEFRTSDRRTRHTTYGDFFVGEVSRAASVAWSRFWRRYVSLVAHHHDSELGDPLLQRGRPSGSGRPTGGRKSLKPCDHW